MYYGEERGFCKTIFKAAGQEEMYFNRIDGNDGKWYTVYPSGGYWENSSLVSNDVIFEIADKNGKPLFAEGNGTEEKLFRSIDEMVEEQCQKWAEKHNLRTYTEWRDMLAAEKEICKNEDYIDNWLYFCVNSTNKIIVGTFEHLGLSFNVIKTEYAHRICKREWICYSVYNTETGVCEGICGYVF
jgi:hypothetical protein